MILHMPQCNAGPGAVGLSTVGALEHWPVLSLVRFIGAAGNISGPISEADNKSGVISFNTRYPCMLVLWLA